MQVTGHVVRSRYLFIKKYEEADQARFLEALSPTTREVFESGPLETKWYDIGVVIEAMEVADRVLGKGDQGLWEEMGNFSAEHTFTGVFRGLLFKFGSVGFALKRAAKAWRSHYDSGQMEVVVRELGKTELRLSDLPEEGLHECICMSIQGWLLRAVELVGSEVKSYELLRDHPEPGQITFRAEWI